ncbi:universal stress protein [Flammeovirgaceae bacterium SG7u.111]|nr:universal stress protein [Flammeovirgaceae bacterium SG7u.132]WPO37990.1 universal stress protein [Flammeovirgaceae bacterium SG7u.111]
MKTILVTIDFEKGDQLLIDKAYEFAAAFNAKIWIVHIAAPDPDFVGYGVGPQHVRDSRASDLKKEHQQLQEYAALLNNHGIDAESLLVQGATIKMVIEEAQKLHADLIVAGHREHGFLYKALVGSVSSEIINRSKIPVLIVPLEG